MPCFGTRLGSHPGGEASEVQANKGKRWICQDKVALSRPNLHDTLSAKFCRISHNTLGVREAPDTSELVHFLAAIDKGPDRDS